MTRLEETAQYILSHAKAVPLVAVTLGSGLGAVEKVIHVDAELPYAEIPGFVSTTVAGHAGKLLLGDVCGVPCAMMCGRVHMYEGNSAADTAYGVYALAKAGVKNVILTNAAGAVNTAYEVGDLVLITDHINMRGVTPICPEYKEAFGSGFIDMTTAYHPQLNAYLRSAAQKKNIPLREGVYMMWAGPQFETPAEIRATRLLGGDLVGMSTIPEVIAARHCGIRAAAVSCVTNMAAGISKAPLSHQEVMETGARIQGSLMDLLQETIAAIGAAQE